MYTRDTAFSTWPTNCTGQQRSSTFGFWFGMGTRDVNAQVAATAAVAPKDIIFGKKTSFLEIIDYYTICPTEYPSSLVHPVKSSIIGGCWAAAATCDRILLQKRSGSPHFNASDRWLTCMRSKYRRRRGAQTEGEHFQIIRCCGVLLTPSLSSLSLMITMISKVHRPP